MAISVQRLLQHLNIKTVELSEFDDIRCLFFSTSFITKHQVSDMSGSVFYRCILIGAGFDSPHYVSIECKKCTELTLKTLCEIMKHNLKDLDLTHANLHGADLQGAHLEVADLDGSNLESANLQKAYLEAASLKRSNLTGANLQYTDMALTNLYGANLCKAQLQGANLLYANLRDSNLLGANLEGVTYISPDALDGARYDLHTKGLTPQQKKGMLFTE